MAANRNPVRTCLQAQFSSQVKQHTVPLQSRTTGDELYDLMDDANAVETFRAVRIGSARHRFRCMLYNILK